jgi:DNA polymerase-4
MNHQIIHLDVPDFRVAVEEVRNPRLRHRPVAVALVSDTRSLIFSASEQARQNGIFSGMPLHKAYKNCSDLIVLPPNEDLYVRATHAMIKVFNEFSPVIEPRRYGHGYLDMTGNRLFGPTVNAAFKAQREILHRLNLRAFAGVASNKLVSKVASSVAATRNNYDALCHVAPGEEEIFLSPLSIWHLPGVTRKVRARLFELNIKIIKELADISPHHLEMALGRTGLLLHQRAHGIDNSPVQPIKRAPEIIEQEKLAQDSNDVDLLRAAVFRLLARAVRKLRHINQQTTQLSLDAQYSDFKDARVHKRVHATDSENDLLSDVDELFERLFARRIRVRKLGLGLGALVPVPSQLSLFDEHNQHPKIEALNKAMDKIRDKYGDNAVFYGRAA